MSACPRHGCAVPGVILAYGPLLLALGLVLRAIVLLLSLLTAIRRLGLDDWSERWYAFVLFWLAVGNWRLFTMPDLVS